ncbi:MAG: hypothetical protein KDG89_11830 [Geminicoccaceae bacterium]|nr:hypothetical protein [Geminicoccaceae bacterium]
MAAERSDPVLSPKQSVSVELFCDCIKELVREVSNSGEPYAIIADGEIKAVLVDIKGYEHQQKALGLSRRRSVRSGAKLWHLLHAGRPAEVDFDEVADHTPQPADFG